MQKWVAEQFATQRRKAGISCAGEGFATHSVAKMCNFATQNGILPPKALKSARFHGFFQVIDSNFVAAVQKSKIKQTRHFRRCHCDSAFFCAGSEPHPYARSVMRSACKLASSLTAPTGVARKLRAYLRSLSASAHRSEANAAATRRSRYMPESQ
ncbi:hypothetical protein [Bilifractor porci]|uniref:Uncharacterized protein n=1 Tax=Bilifractor porci TaxID=2606636 RepID=A0A7X2PB17_9FIRM|nr:hypothetical protein [Bilifractor porci]MST82993.1 hypothetical protein [Bilifractor porci]